MSYNAKYEGCIKFETAVEKEKIWSILSADFDNISFSDDSREIFFDGNDRYNEDSVYCALNALSQNYRIEAASVEYEGEDGALWKHEYDVQEQSWKEYQGMVTYPEEALCRF